MAGMTADECNAAVAKAKKMTGYLCVPLQNR